MTELIPLDQAATLWFWQTGNVLIFLLAISDLVFVIFYATQFPWWRYPLGRALLYVAIAILLTSVNGFIGVFVDPQSAYFWNLPPDPGPWRPLTRFFTFLIATGAVLNVLRILWERRFHPERGPLVGIPEGPFKPRVPGRGDTGPVSTPDPAAGQ